MYRHKDKIELIEEFEIIKKSMSNPRYFAPIYQRYYHEIFIFIQKKTNNRELTADIVSIVFTKAIQNLHQYKYKGVPFVAWLYRIASNEANTFFRKSKVQRTISLDSTIVISITDDIETVDEASHEKKMSDFISALDQLSEDELEFIELKYFEKLSFKEISYIKNVSVTNAKVKTHRIIQKLKKLISKKK